MAKKVFVSIVTHNHAATIDGCIAALLEQKGFSTNTNLAIHVIDNSSEDQTPALLDKYAPEQISYLASRVNLGFSAANNIAVAKFLRSDYDLFLLLNPDLKLTPECLETLCSRVIEDNEVDFATPLLLQCDQDLNPLHPERIDSAGMILLKSLRHLDRGQGQLLESIYTEECYVFGATGACCLMKRSFIEDMLLKGERHENDLYKIYPELEVGSSERAPLLDEAFFAFREDADLCWRAQLLGKNCLYFPKAQAYHLRRVNPQKRSKLPNLINYLGVRNRFLLQLNNYAPLSYPTTIVTGLVMRNLIVLAAIMIRERSSLGAVRDIFYLFNRQRERHNLLLKMGAQHQKVLRWLKAESISIR